MVATTNHKHRILIIGFWLCCLHALHSHAAYSHWPRRAKLLSPNAGAGCRVPGPCWPRLRTAAGSQYPESGKPVSPSLPCFLWAPSIWSLDSCKVGIKLWGQKNLRTGQSAAALLPFCSRWLPSSASHCRRLHNTAASHCSVYFRGSACHRHKKCPLLVCDSPIFTIPPSAQYFKLSKWQAHLYLG